MLKYVGAAISRHKHRFRNTFWLVGEDIFRRMLNFFLLIILTRYLGVARFGMLSYALNFLPMLPPLVALGTDKLTMQYLVHYPKKNAAVMGTALFIRSLMGVILIPVIFYVAYQLQPEDALLRWMMIIITSGVAFETSNVFGFWFQAKEKLAQAALARTVGFILAISWRLILIWVKAPLIAFAWSYLGERLLIFLCLGAVQMLTAKQFQRWRFDTKLAAELLRKGLPLMLTQLTLLLYLRLDIILLEHYSGPQAVGIYSLALRICDPLSYLGLALIMAFSPILIGLYKHKKKYYWQRLAGLGAGLSALGYLLIGLLIICAGPLIAWLFGPEYAAVGPLLSVLSWTVLLVYLGELKETTLILEKQQSFYFLSMVAALVLSVILNINLMPHYGFYGAAVARILVGVFFDLLLLLIYPPTRKLATVLMSSLLLFPLLRTMRGSFNGKN